MRRRLNDAEALMWRLGQHPMLASTMGSIVMLDGTPDTERFVRSMAHSVLAVESLHHRVASPPLPLADLEWEPDPDFDLEHHVRILRLPARAGIDEVTAAATRLIDDPFDRSRPPWSMTLLTGAGRGRSALVIKADHAIADGQGMLRLGANLFDFSDDAPPRPPVDLDAAMRAAGSGTSSAKDAVTDAIRSRVERLLGLAVEGLGAAGSPDRARQLVDELGAATQLVGGANTTASASTAWQRRSRNRRSLHLTAPLDELRTQAAARDCSINDLFVTACAEAAIGYHRTLGEELPHVVTSVVVSTRTEDDPDAHNAVIPSAVVVPGAGASTDERLRAVQQQVAERRAAIDRHQGGLDAASRIAGFVPPMVAAAAAIDQARRIDIATSNLPGPPMPMWLAGVPVRWISPLGPVAGTACNITMLTFCDDAALGVHYDPNAVADARLLGSELVSALARLQISCRGRSPRTR